MTRKKIAILGGGISAMVCALKLTETEALRARHDITVYQMGWRLGGKGASGRNMADGTWRNKEHGLHMLFGFYENTFFELRKVFAELGSDWVWTIDDAFKGHTGPLVMYQHQNDGWDPWPLWSLKRDGEPGDGQLFPFDPQDIVRGLIKTAHSSTGGPSQSLPDRILTELTALEDTLRGARSGATQGIFDRLGRWIDAELDGLGAKRSLGQRRHLLMSRFLLVMAKGITEDLLLGKKRWFDLDDLSFEDWLRSHGATEEMVQSPLAQGPIASVFSESAGYGAGTALHSLASSIVRNKGWPIYAMQAGMGDTIFAPIFTLLERRGVKFEFFHRVQNLGVDASGFGVERIDINVQAELTHGRYEPLAPEPNNGLPCWPDRPFYDQLVDGDRLRREKIDFENWWETTHTSRKILRRGEDFDEVVLGISIAAFPYIARELASKDTRFANMVLQVLTTDTQAAQLWLNTSLVDLGFDSGAAPPHGRSNARAVATPFALPFDTWADMSHLNRQHDIPDCKAQLYLCSHLSDTGPLPPQDGRNADYPYGNCDRVRVNARDWLDRNSQTLWPRASVGGRFDDAVLVPFEDDSTPFESQYFTSTLNPSDRYVLSVPGSNRFRLRAGETLFENLTLCGDWTKTAFSVGCVEAATMSGIDAARNLAGTDVPKAFYDWLDDPVPRARQGARLIPRDGTAKLANRISMGTRVRCFVLEADYFSLQRTVDEKLNHHSRIRYEPISRTNCAVMFYTSGIGTESPATSIDEVDCGFWIPLRKIVDGKAVAVVTYSPYLWVNSAAALVGGRFVFGFPKHLSSVKSLHPSLGRIDHQLDTYVQLRQHDSPTEQTLLRLSTAADPAPLGVFAEAEALLDGVIDRHFGSDLNWRMIRELFHQQGMCQVFLKQISAAAEPGSAAYQCLLESDIRISGGFDGRMLPADSRLSILDCYSHRITESLGLEVQGYRAPYFEVQPIFEAELAFQAVVEPQQLVARLD